MLTTQVPDLKTTDKLSNSDDVILEFFDVQKGFVSSQRKTHALKNVSLGINRGIVTGLIGPDGAGKTTLMRLAAGLIAPDAGHITVLGMNATTDYLEVQATIGYMPQRFGLYEDLSVQENLDLYADLQGVPKELRPERYHELMRMTGLASFTSRLARRLSGGMKQKLGLACTLVRTPELLLLDEPTVGVDPVSRRELWEIIYRLIREQETSVFISTAYMDEAERCEEVILLHEGEILGYGTPAQFKESVRGKTFTLAAHGMKKRKVQEKIEDSPSVIDAVIQGSRIRLVLDVGASPDIQTLLPDVKDIKGVSIEPSPPRLEDSFISILRTRQAENERSRKEFSKMIVQKQIADSEENVILVTDVKRRFGDFDAVKGVTFVVTRGEVFGLLGPNGAGKSTTFRMLCGLLPASEGTLRVAGVDMRDAPAAARARIGYMSQKFSLYGNLSVRQNLLFFSGAYGLSGSRQSARVEWALDEFDLYQLGDTNSTDLPLGYKQRLAMACALMHEPDILFLDEPTSGVDPIARREFWRRINSLAEQGVTVMVTTHFMEEAEYCDRLAIMSDGEILALGNPEEIKERERSSENPEPNMEDAFISLIMRKKNGIPER
jgi:ABC-2 type transport system ATP-binding protein